MNGLTTILPATTEFRLDVCDGGQCCYAEHLHTLRQLRVSGTGRKRLVTLSQT